MRLMALDYGSKRVGVASTDESGQFAIPRMVLENNADLLENILKFIKENNIEGVVLGESKNLDGKANPIQEEVDKFKKELEKQGLQVSLHPEILTTLEARRLQGNTDMTDASAASLILKSFIDTMYNKDA